MARYFKTYKTHANETRIPLKLGDVTLDAHFVNGNIRDNQWATLETSDPLEQMIIERHSLFGKVIFLEKQVEIEEPEEAADMQPGDITTLEQAREYLVRNFGVDKRSISAPNALKAVAREKGVAFPNLK